MVLKMMVEVTGEGYVDVLKEGQKDGNRVRKN